jgi:hypothetical protein
MEFPPVLAAANPRTLVEWFSLACKARTLMMGSGEEVRRFLCA